MMRSTKLILIATLVASMLSATVLAAGDGMSTLRGGPLDSEAAPPPMPNVLNDDQRRKRSYPMQPPTIPHKIDQYQVDLNANKCLSCHSRSRTVESQAPMVSVTHFMDRDGNFLADVSPRRYFCNQCHVVQTDAKVIVETDFKDVDELLKADKAR